MEKNMKNMKNMKNIEKKFLIRMLQNLMERNF